MDERATTRGMPARSVRGNPPPLSSTIRDFRTPDRSSRRHLKLVAGYEILEKLGEGGMGVVWKARQVQLDRIVALKMLRSRCASRDDLVRFRIEAEAVARLVHPGIVQIYEVGEHEGQPFFSLEYVAGGSLDHLIDGKPLLPAAAARLVRTLACSIHAAHSAGIVHRDLKPANVLLSSPGASMAGRGEIPGGMTPSHLEPKVTDFGLAKRLDAASGQTQAGEVLGTPSYMAPEQAEGRTDVGPACDIWALGAILYECLTGRPPFASASVLETLQQVRSQDPIPPRRLQSSIPGDLEIICLKCLQKNAKKRYRSAADLSEDLDRFLTGVPIHARRIGIAERAWKWARRHPTTAMLIVVCCFLFLGLMAALPLTLSELNRRVEDARQELERTNRKSRRATLEQRLAEGKAGLRVGKRHEVEDALGLFAAVQEEIGEDPDPILFKLLEEATQLRQTAARELERLIGAGPALARSNRFLSLRDEAFFHLYHDLAGIPDSSRPETCRDLCRQALAIFPELDCLSCQDQNRLRGAQHEVRLLLADATSRLEGGSPHRIREALRLLDLAEAEGAPLHSLRLRRARFLAELGHRSQANEQRQLASKAPPRGALDWFVRGLERWKGNDLAGALEDFQYALDAEPELYWSRLLRAAGLQRLRRDTEALAELGLCIRARKDFPWPYLMRAALQARNRRLDAAASDLAQVGQLELVPNARYAWHLNMALVALGRDQLREAATECQKAIFLDPHYPQGYANLAQVYWRKGMRARAGVLLDQALCLSPSQPDLHRTRAQLRKEMGDFQGALLDLDSADRAQSGSRLRSEQASDLRERSRLLYGLGRYAEALPNCRQALTLQPGHPGALRLHAEVLLELSRHADAVLAFSRFLEKGTADVEVYRRRARARAGIGDFPGVVEDYTLALALKSDPSLYTARGWARLLVQSPRQALADFEKALNLTPGNPDALIGRGTARLDLGEIKVALADIEAGLAGRPHQTRILYSAARGLARGAARLPRQPRDLERRAAEVLKTALESLPAEERGRFLRDKVRQDEAFRNLGQRGYLDSLAKQLATSSL